MDFDKLYSEQFQPTYIFIRYMVGHAELAEDLTQETFYRIFELPPPTHALRGGGFLRPPAYPPVTLVG